MSKSMPLLAAREAKNQRAASTPISPSSSSRVMNSPESLGHRDFLAVADEADPRRQDHLDVSRSKPSDWAAALTRAT
jgi:hypothetical protein